MKRRRDGCFNGNGNGNGYSSGNGWSEGGGYGCDAAGLLLTSAVFWFIVWLCQGDVATLLMVSAHLSAWLGLYLCCAVAAPLAWRVAPLKRQRPRVWLYFAGYAVLLAAGFFGANQGLDALHGAHRHKADIAAALGGIELWLVLVPGIFSVCVGGWLRARLSRAPSRQ